MTITINTFAKNYKKETGFKVADFNKICKLFFYKLSKAIIENAFRIKLPFGIGEIYVMRKIPKKPKYDFNTYNKTGVLVRFLNLHSSGYMYWIHLRKGTGINSKFYQFKAIADKTKREIGSRGLARHIKYCDENNIPFIAYDE